MSRISLGMHSSFDFVFIVRNEPLHFALSFPAAECDSRKDDS